MVEAKFLKPDTLALHAGQHPDPVTGVIEWLPGFGDSGIYRDLRILATDGRLTTQASIQVTVLPANAPPELDSVPPRVVREGRRVRVDTQFHAGRPLRRRHLGRRQQGALAGHARPDGDQRQRGTGVRFVARSERARR